MAVLTADAQPINWLRPPKGTALVLWAHQGKRYKTTFRNACHMEALNRAAVKKFGVEVEVHVHQPCFNKGVAASAGTHDFGETWDVSLPGVPWDQQNIFFRARGFAGWVRTPAQGFSYHYHGFSLPPREGKDVSDDFRIAGYVVGLYVDGGWSTRGARVTSSQIEDYYNHAFGLSGKHTRNSDRSQFPKDIEATIFNLDAFVGAQHGIVAPPVAPPAPAPLPDGRRRVDGVDISHHQSGTVSFAKAKAAGVKWVYHKATEGTTYKDPNYDKRRKAAKRAKVPFGAYHFARPSAAKGDATREARFFLATAKPVPGDLLPVLDIETNEGLSVAAIQAWVAEFSRAVRKVLGVRPIIYTQSSWDLGPDNEKNHLMWRARYNDDNRPPSRPWDIHQFSNGVLGHPDAVAGFGHVDLSYMRPGLTLDKMILPAKQSDPLPPPAPQPPPTPTPVPVPPPAPAGREKATLRFCEVSMQFSDNTEQKKMDVDLIFHRGYHVILGTEAGPGAEPMNELLHEAATKYGYHLSITGRYDTWVAVHKSIIKGGWDVGAEFALWRSSRTPGKHPGRWGDKGIIWAEWSMGPKWGTMSVGSIHTLTHGGAGPALKKSSDIVYADVMWEWMQTHGLGDDIALLGGDFNLVDRRNDLAHGHPMVSLWDDLKDWPNTGHGNIDTLLRDKAEKRVKFLSARVLDDDRLFLNTDHFLFEAEVQITALH